MRANRVSAYVFAVAASLAGCTGTGDVAYSGQVRVSAPELIEVSPGVQVIADADEPLFYSDGYYWLYRDGYWSRSDDYRSGFARVELSYVPERIRVIDRPQAYVQYRRHHGRDFSARATPAPTRNPRPTPYYPPPNQGVPSTPAPDTWQQPGVNPVPQRPVPTPPITSPGDVHGNPMPPPHAPIRVDRPHEDNRPQARMPQPPARDQDRKGNNDDRGQRTREDRNDRNDRATPPSPPPKHDAKHQDDDRGRKKKDH